MKLYRYLKQHFCQQRIILIGHCIAGQKRVDSEILSPLCLQCAKGLKHLLCGHAILGIPGIVHDIIADLKHASRIVPAADRLRNLSNSLLQAPDMGKIIQIDDRPQIMGKLKLLRRRVIGRKHDLRPAKAAGVGHHQLCQRRAVGSAPFLL